MFEECNKLQTRWGQWFVFFASGYPCCHESCARNYYKILWDLGDKHETSFQMGLN